MIKKTLNKLRRKNSKPEQDHKPADSPAESSAATSGEPTTPKSPYPFSPKPVTRYDKAMPTLADDRTHNTPLISIVLIVYKMAEQAQKTLYSLSTEYQRGVDASDYEVIVVENNSDSPMSEAQATSFAGNFRYFYREETLPTPVNAINFGAEQSRGQFICVMIDGARMVTPGIVAYIKAATLLSNNPVISVPGYHLGHELQQKAVLNGYNREQEQKLLDSISWPDDGYRLFDIACLSGTSAGGFFKPIGESNCVCVSRETYTELGGFDPGFTETGGGQVNLDFYKRAVELPETDLFLLPGEGSFHQLHGGVTTESKGADRDREMTAHFTQYASLRGEAYSPPEKRAVYLGAIPDSALKFIRHGANKVIQLNHLE